MITIEHDPATKADGGFPPGAKLSKENFYLTMRFANFTEGTIIKVRTPFEGVRRGRYIVLDKNGGGQELKRCKKEMI
jgi:hypothetical protein